MKNSDREDLTLQDTTATNCVAALDNLVRLSKLGAATRETVDHLHDLAELCSEANATIAAIKANLADDETVEDPRRMAAVLNQLNRITSSVEDANRRADARIVHLRATG